MELARKRLDYHAFRVESKASIADGPTRFDWTWVERLQATHTPPRLPEWVFQVLRLE